MRIPDRRAGGRLLARAVGRLDVADPVVVGLGPGGVAVGWELARSLGCPLDMIDLTELDDGDALHPNRTFAAVSRDGHVLIRPGTMERSRRGAQVVRAAVSRARQAAAAFGQASAGRGPVPTSWRTVILVEDGTASREVVAAALDLVRAGRPGRVLLAVPTAPQEIIEELGRLAGDVIVGSVAPWTEWFHWHGRIYDDDARPSEEQIGELLHR